MALRTSNLVESTRTFDMPFNGETVQITYRLGELNQDFWTWYGQHAMKPESLFETIERLVLHWDVLDDTDQPIPATVEAIKAYRLPTPFLRCVQNAIFEDAQPGKLSASPSSEHSPRAERSARSRNGTRG